MFIIRCNKEITPHLAIIVEICSDMIKYDPNYEYDNEEAENGDAMEVDDSDENFDDDIDEYSGKH
jgi:cullin-associated NEDD8-dissociated protein 1